MLFYQRVCLPLSQYLTFRSVFMFLYLSSHCVWLSVWLLAQFPVCSSLPVFQSLYQSQCCLSVCFIFCTLFLFSAMFLYLSFCVCFLLLRYIFLNFDFFNNVFCLLASLVLIPPGIAALCFGCDTVLFCPPLGAFQKWNTLPARFCWFAQIFVDFVTVLFFFFFFFVSHG